MFIALWLLGCEAIDNAKDAVDGATETTVIQASILSVQEPQDENLQALIQATAFSPGTTAAAFVADASSPTEMENSPVTGAAVDVEGVALDEKEDGAYAFTPDRGPRYAAGSSWVLTVDRGDDEGERTAVVALPAPAADALNATGIGGSVEHTANTALMVDLTGRGYASSIIAVIGPDGDLAYSNNPESLADLYDAMQSDEAGVFEIPASAFAETGLYAVGIAGLQHTTAEDLDGFNTVISKVRAGEMVFWPVNVE